MEKLRSVSDTLAQRRNLLDKELEKFKATWYLDNWFVKAIFLWGALSIIALIIYGVYLLL